MRKAIKSLEQSLEGLDREVANEKHRAEANRKRQKEEIRKACQGKPFDAAFVEQHARENSSDPAAFIRAAISSCERQLRAEAIDTQIAEAEAEKARILTTIRENLKAKADAEAQQNAANVFDRWGEPKAGAGLAEVEAWRDCVRDVARFADREFFARRELAKVERQIKTLRDSR